LWDFWVDDPYRNFVEEPLLRRAWTFQERFLAPRTLHFTNSQIFWECNENHWCETYPNGTLLRRTQPSRFPKVAQKPSEIWPNTVTLYSTGSLSYPTDKLVAISGVAKWLGAQTKDDYLAGIWRKDLVKQLCWKRDMVQFDSSSHTRPTAYLAPSWSWASIIGSISYSRFLRLEWAEELIRPGTQVRVLSAHTVLEDENCRFGKVKTGVLRLVVERLIFGFAMWKGPYDVRQRISSRWRELSSAKNIYWDCPKEPKNSVYILTVFSTNIAEYGIILEPTDESRRGEYRRVGYYESGGASSFPLDEDDELLYEGVEENGEKLRVISIV